MAKVPIGKQGGYWPPLLFLLPANAKIPMLIQCSRERNLTEPNHNYRDDLLTPVLESEPMPVPAYSTRAQFFTAFFGDAFAIILLAGLNAHHMGRLKKDSWRYGLALVLSIGAVGWLVTSSMAPSQPAWLTDIFGGDSTRALRWGGRLFGLLVWLALWLPYRRYHKAAEIMGAEPRSPWIPALLCVGGAFVLQIAIAFSLKGL
jgi:hypothetical protein